MATNQIVRRQLVDGIINNAKIAADAAIVNSKFAAFVQDQDFGGFKGTNAGAPTNPNDLARLVDVQNAAVGLQVKLAVRAATTANISVTYSNTGGASARGQITGAPNTLDGVTLAANNRLLLKDMTAADSNGIWVVTTLGSGSNGVWDRASDFDTDAEVTANAFVFIEEGTQNADTGWVLTTNNPITIGGASGTSLAWTQFTGAGATTAGAGLTKTGNTIDVVAADTSITVNTDSIQVNLNGGTLDVSSGLRVANAGITATQLNTSVAGPGIGGGAGTALFADWVFETPSGTVNGSNQVFTASNTIASNTASPTLTTDIMVFVNGVLQKPSDYTRSGTAITLTDAPLTGEGVLFFYFK